MTKIHLLSRLRKGQRVRIRYDNGREFGATFIELVTGEFKGAKFNIENSNVTILTAELSAGWVTIYHETQ